MKIELDSLLGEVGKIPEWYHNEHLRSCIVASTSTLNEPVNVGVVGLIKAGKSTFVNALIGDQLARVGNIETTYNVCKYQYGSSKTYDVIHRNGRVDRLGTLDEVLEFTVRAGKIESSDLDDVELIRIHYPSTMLRQINIIDTPGLSSVYEADEENTKRFLESHGQRLSAVTVDSLNTCDAILYLFSKGVHQSFSETLSNFVTLGDVSPLRSVGILSKVDMYFDVEEQTDVMPVAHRIISRLYDSDGLNKYFLSLMPICGRIAAGSNMISESDVNVVSEICQLSGSDYIRFFRSVNRISDSTAFIGVNLTQRKLLLDTIGLYGIFRMCVHYRNGVRNVTDFQSILGQESGIDAVRTLMTSHFEARRTAIKAKQITESLLRVWRDQKANVDVSSRRSSDIAVQRLQSYTMSHIKHILDEVAAVRILHGRTNLMPTETHQESLRILGGFGSALDSRIDIDIQDHFSSAIESAMQRLSFWRRQLPINSMLDRDLEFVTTVVIRSYEKVAHRLKVAQSAFTD